MRAIVTGQIGMRKKPYLEAVADLAGERGGRIELFHVGEMMYAEAPDIRAGRILDLPLSRLTSLRRAAFKDIIAGTSPPEDHPNVIVNTHGTFRWRHRRNAERRADVDDANQDRVEVRPRRILHAVGVDLRLVRAECDPVRE